MSKTSAPGLKRILMAALTLFGRNGFQRTSMADIAREAEIARATLYLRFSDKNALFEALAVSLVDEALERAEAAWDPDATLSKNIAATLLAKDLGFFQMINSAPHGAEMLKLHAERTAVHVARLDKEFATLLTRRGREMQKRGADLSAFDNAAGFAAFLATTGSGLKHEARTEEAFRSAVGSLARVAAHAAGKT